MKYLFTILLTALLLTNNAQSLVRSSIGSLGNSVVQNGTSIQQTIGQSTVPGTASVAGTDLRQGFIQPPLVGNHLKLFGNSQINLWPNPTQGVFTFTVTGPATAAFNYSIYSVSGSLMAGGHGNFNTPVSITETNMAQGLYFLTVTSGPSPVAVCKFIVER